MKHIIFALCCMGSAQLMAQELYKEWDGGDLQFEFSAKPYQQREPRLTQEEYQVLNTVVDLVKQQRHDDAIAELRLQLARSPSSALWFSLAQLQQQQQRFSVAIESLRHAIELLPQFTRAHESLGRILTQQGDYQAARPHLRQAGSQGAAAPIYAMLGYGYLHSEQPQAAQAAYSHALMLAGDNHQWQRGLLHSTMAAGDYGLAGSLTEQLLSATPDDAQLHRLRASLAQRQQNWPKAIASLEIAQQLEHSDQVQWQLAQIYLDRGYFQSAQLHLSELVSNGVEGRQQRLLEVADYLIGQQQWALATTVLDTLNSSGQLSANERSRALTSQAKLLAEKDPKTTVSQQVNLLHRALKHNPLNGPALIALASRIQPNEPAEAEALYRRAAVLPAIQLEALQRHAQLLLSQQAYRRAEQLLQQAVKQAPNDVQLQQNLAAVTRMVQSQS